MRQNEESWILTGGHMRRLWWSHLSHRSEGHPGAVGFPYQWVMEREKKVGDVIGFLHTHPGFLASPSMRDDATMQQWVLSFGKPLVCLIEGINGLRGYLYYNDEREPIAMPIIKRFGDLIVGITPKITQAEVVGEEDVGGKVVDWDDEMRPEYDFSKLTRVPRAGEMGRAARSLEPMELTPEDAAVIESQLAKPNIPIEPVQEYKDYFTRTLVRVISAPVGEEYIEVLVPGWEPEKIVRLSKETTPIGLCQEGKRFHCQCNINVEDERDLIFKNFEE